MVRAKTEASSLRHTFVTEVLCDLACLAVLLVRFEDIDVIQQLEREVRNLKKASEEVEAQHEKMNEFWGNAMELSELWLYRTVPRLELYKDVHQHIEDCKTPKQLAQYITGANRSLEDLETNLGQLQNWREGGTFSTEEKKKFKEVMTRVGRVQNADEQIAMLASSVESKKAMESWSGTDKGAGRAKPIADKNDRSGKLGKPDKGASNGRSRAQTDGAAMSNAPSEVQGFLQSNENAFKKW